ncbi:MAG: hypothetical protein ACK59W_04605, partial [Pseudanabaena sp.]
LQLTCTTMNEYIRILETGEINTGEGLFRFVAPEKIPFWQDFAQKTEIIRGVHEHGAVSFEVDANYDEDCHEPEEEFGWGLTYGEYWDMHPEQKRNKPVACWQTWILLSVSAPFMRFRRSLSPAEDRILIATWDTVRWNEDLEGGEYRFYLALTSKPDTEDDTLLDAQKPVFIKPRKIFPIVSDRTALGSLQTWQLGQDMILQPLTNFVQASPSQRDWDWMWREHASLGPICLKIFVDRTSAELKEWFANIITTRLTQNNFYPCLYDNQYAIAEELRIYFEDLEITELSASEFYQCVEDLQTQRQGRLPQVYCPDQDYSYVAKSSDIRTGWIVFCDGLFCLDRSYHTPNFDQQSLDAMLLTAIMAGELGEISWDLFDSDYIYFEATGEGLESLRNYLDSNSDPDRLRQEFSRLLVRHDVEASSANNVQEAAALITQHFQVPLTELDAIANLEAWLRTTAISQLPRYVTVKLPRRLGNTYSENPDYSRITSANSRILWRWSFDG